MEALSIQTWAENLGTAPDGAQLLAVSTDARPVAMAHSPATGQGLVTNGQLGVDVIRLAAGDGFVPHTHPGDHLLIIIAGHGTITYAGRIYPTQAGQVYMVAGAVPHAVGAMTDHVILAVGSPHRAVDDPLRMTVSAYQEILAQIQTLTCCVCGITASHPTYLHAIGCSHCPCGACHPDGLTDEERNTAQ